jgi:hypothetical protein
MTRYKYVMLDNARWGIFFDDRLLASVSSQKEASHLVRNLQQKLKFDQRQAELAAQKQRRSEESRPSSVTLEHLSSQ